MVEQYDEVGLAYVGITKDADGACDSSIIMFYSAVSCIAASKSLANAATMHYAKLCPNSSFNTSVQLSVRPHPAWIGLPCLP
jgi:hypothetical protein